MWNKVEFLILIFIDLFVNNNFIYRIMILFEEK